jgi:hypothetical protein
VNRRAVAALRRGLETLDERLNRRPGQPFLPGAADPRVLGRLVALADQQLLLQLLAQPQTACFRGVVLDHGHLFVGDGMINDQL